MVRVRAQCVSKSRVQCVSRVRVQCVSRGRAQCVSRIKAQCVSVIKAQTEQVDDMNRPGHRNSLLSLPTHKLICPRDSGVRCRSFWT